MANMYPSYLAGGGGYSGTAQPADVLTGETFINANGPQTGSMINNGAVDINLTSGQTYTVPEGYHNGNGTVTAPTSQRSFGVISSGFLILFDGVSGKNIRASSGTFDFGDFIVSVTNATTFSINVPCTVYTSNMAETQSGNLNTMTTTSVAANTNITASSAPMIVVI